MMFDSNFIESSSILLITIILLTLTLNFQHACNDLLANRFYYEEAYCSKQMHMYIFVLNVAFVEL